MQVRQSQFPECQGSAGPAPVHAFALHNRGLHCCEGEVPFARQCPDVVRELQMRFLSFVAIWAWCSHALHWLQQGCSPRAPQARASAWHSCTPSDNRTEVRSHKVNYRPHDRCTRRTEGAKPAGTEQVHLPSLAHTDSDESVLAPALHRNGGAICDVAQSSKGGEKSSHCRASAAAAMGSRNSCTARSALIGTLSGS